MVKVRWKFERERVYLEVISFEEGSSYYWFPKLGQHKRFHPRQIFTRNIHHKAYKDSLIPKFIRKEGWKDDWLNDDIVRKKLGLIYLTQKEYYEQLSRAC